MTLEPRVSFIVPVRNRVAELRAALASCLAQSIDAWEAVVIDDHSEEDVAAVVAALGDSGLRYYRQSSDRRGVAAARESAIARARTDILITLDADDLNHPHRAHRCLELLQIPGPRLIYTRVRLFIGSDGRNWPKPVFQPFNLPLLELFNFITNPGTAFNRLAYEVAGGHLDHSLAIGEDYDLYLRMARQEVSILGLDEEHVSYRKGGASTTAGREEAMHRAIMQIRRKHAVPPFPLEELRLHALPELCRNILDDPAMRQLWSDDRWCPHG
ncbi:glycosyltransferase family 2 protein [Vulcanococcus limneticus]|uniref:glycosyltransferase family 2 protein n=1 Tax=Vulcanococcus limneticus TaxID=2170428 RepID=UPI00398BFD4C